MAVSTGRSWATEVCNPWPGVRENAPASRGYSGGLWQRPDAQGPGLGTRGSDGRQCGEAARPFALSAGLRFLNSARKIHVLGPGAVPRSGAAADPSN